tara:strand:- start:2748 stop:2879 length:132 start_codon:yes stop_codon:yes gene_type:complete
MTNHTKTKSIRDYYYSEKKSFPKKVSNLNNTLVLLNVKKSPDI